MDHSRLLKFLVPARRDSINMEETPSFKVQYEYQNPNNVESEVPGSQNIREVTEKHLDENTDGAETQNGGYTITRSSYTEHSETVEGTQIIRTSVTLSSNSTNEEQITEEKSEIVSEKTQTEDIKPRTKIPKLQFRQAAEKVKNERRIVRDKTEHETHIPVPKTSNSKLTRISKIPPPTSKPHVVKRESTERVIIRPDEEFDKIYEEIVENTTTEIEIKNPKIIENKFEEIIHDYDENKIQPINVEKIRQSRIPSLRRRTSEHAESKTEKLVISEKNKTRSLPRLKEISMRVKADDDNLNQMKYSRSVSSETNTSGGKKIITETRITKNPGADAKLSKIITTETVASGKDRKNKDFEGSSESVTVHRTLRVTSDANESVNVHKKIDQPKMTSETENILKESVKIAYPAFESKIVESSNEISKVQTDIRELIDNEGKSFTSEENNVTNLQTTNPRSNSSIQSRTITKVSVRKLGSKYDSVTGVKEISNDKKIVNEKETLLDIKDQSPITERSVTITRVVSSNNDNEQIKKVDSPKSPTTEKNSVTRITTERRFLDAKSTIPAIERSTSVSRVVSLSNDIKVQNVEEFKSAAKENGSSIVEKTLTETKFVEDKSPTVERSLNITRVISSVNNDRPKNLEDAELAVKESNNSIQTVTTGQNFTDARVTASSDTTVKKIQHSKSLIDEKENIIEKDTARRTIVRAISTKIGENREDSIVDPPEEKNDSNVESYQKESTTKIEELTTVKGKVEKIIHKIDSNEVTTETTKRSRDDLPKTKSILAKIAMFERQEVEDRMPIRQPNHLSKLVIKHPPSKIAHVHTPTIVEEVLKTQDNSPSIAKIYEDVNPVNMDQSNKFDYKLEVSMTQEDEVGHTKEILNQVSTPTAGNTRDYNPTDIKEATTFDYKVTADENSQTVEMTKVKSKVITNIAESEPSITFDIKLRARNDKISIRDYEDKGTSEVNTDSNSKVDDTDKYKFKEVKKLADVYLQRVETDKNALNIRDKHIDLLKPESIKPFKYTFDVAGRKYSDSYNIESHGRTSTSTTESIELDVDVDDNIKPLNYEKTDEVFNDKDASDNVSKNDTPTTEAPTKIEYKFKDVKKLTNEYEQRVDYIKNLKPYASIERLSPLNMNSNSSSIIDLDKVMIDAPVIVVTPKIDFKEETNINAYQQENKNEIAVTRVKEAALQHTAVKTQFTKQISTEYKEHNIEKRNADIQKSGYNTQNSVTILETEGARNISVIETVNQSSAVFKEASGYKVLSEKHKKDYVTQTSTKHTRDNAIHKSELMKVNAESKESILGDNLYTEERTRNIENLEKSGEIKTVKSKGYIIKHEGDLSFAQIQDDNYPDYIEPDRPPRLPRTPPPPKSFSSDIMNRFKNEEEKKKYYADVDINTVFKGKVSRMVSRMTSLQETEKKVINVKEMPRKMSVLEKVAMFEVSEKKISGSQAELSYITRNRTERQKVEDHTMTEEEYEERIMELKSARLTHGMIENMPHMILRNGVEMPVLALGTAMLDRRLIPHIIGAAIDLGYRAIDTAYIYGNEKEIGGAIQAKIADGTVRREDLFITSKLWSTFHRTDLVEKACRSSLEAMGLDYFDLYLIHNPMSFKEGGDAIPKIATVIQYSQFDYLDAWYGMEQLMTKGLVRSIGVSNFNSVQLQRIMDKGKIKPAVNQVESHPYLSQQKLEAFCNDRDIKLSCYGVLGSKGTPAEYKTTLPPIIDDPLVQVMASGLNITPAQLLIRYQLECGRQATVKSSSAKRLWENLQAVTLNLAQGQVDALHALNRNKRTFNFKGMGDTHKNYPFRSPF